MIYIHQKQLSNVIFQSKLQKIKKTSLYFISVRYVINSLHSFFIRTSKLCLRLAVLKDLKFATLLKLNPSQVFFLDFEHRCSCILCRLAILQNTYSNIFAERVHWLLLNITLILLIGSIQSYKEL